MNQPLTLEGWQVWDLAQRLTGQLRIATGMGGATVLGWDMGAAITIARALGVDPLIAAECLPEIEAVMVRKFNEQMASGDRPGPEDQIRSIRSR